jgi:hypothetical protein
MRVGRYLLLAGTLLVAAVALPYAYEFWEEDSCLDGGGSFDYTSATCDHDQNHAYIPFASRHPRAAPTALVGSAIAFLGLYMLKRPA